MKLLRLTVFGSPLWQYLTSIIALVIAVFARMSLDLALGDNFPFITIICAVLLTVTYAGTGPSLLSVVSGLAVGTYLFIPPRGSFEVDDSLFVSRVGVLAFVGLTVIVVIQMLRSAQRQAKDSAERVMKQNKALAQEQQLLRQLFEQQEQRWKLIVYEIHDGILQYTTAALMHAQAYVHTYKSGTTPEQISAATQLLREAVDEGRRLINGIRPPTLDSDGIVPAIEQLIGDHNGEETQVEFVQGSRFERLSPSVETTIYRIVQEALTNAKRHSQSEKIEIKLDHRDDRIHLEVRDWGVGFDPADVPTNRFGLQGMIRRADLLGGAATVESRPGSGTCVRVDLPREAALA